MITSFMGAVHDTGPQRPFASAGAAGSHTSGTRAKGIFTRAAGNKFCEKGAAVGCYPRFGEDQFSRARAPARRGADTQALFSPSALSLLAVNIGVIVFAVRNEWSLPTILASYLLQSVIIGVFQAKKILDLKVFSTEGFTMNHHPVEPTRATQIKVVVFFLFHYGIFHAVYAGFIASEGRPYWPDVLLSGVAFFANHLFSYVMNRNRVPRRTPNIGSMMFSPYIRIMPMHAFIVFGAIFAGPHVALVFFMILKTLADEAMHAIEHYSDMTIG